MSEEHQVGRQVRASARETGAVRGHGLGTQPREKWGAAECLSAPWPLNSLPSGPICKRVRSVPIPVPSSGAM